jgi:predicted methyltransferase
VPTFRRIYPGRIAASELNDMWKRHSIAALLGIGVLSAFLAHTAVADDQPDLKLQQLVAGPQRSAAALARDPARHPYELLHFFGLAEDKTVVEIWPGGTGYWAEILAPYLNDKGRYYAAIGEETEGASDEVVKSNAAFRAKLAGQPDLYGKVTITTFGGDRYDIAPPGTADLVVTFRNLHNWIASHEAEAAFGAFYKALKPGGVLGVEDHRGRTDQPQDPDAKSGYVRQDYAIALAERAGFKFAGSSEVNANGKDTKDYPEGVWTLPPTYRLGDVDRAKYEAIGESDRFVLKFVKPL